MYCFNYEQCASERTAGIMQVVSTENWTHLLTQFTWSLITAANKFHTLLILFFCSSYSCNFHNYLRTSKVRHWLQHFPKNFVQTNGTTWQWLHCRLQKRGKIKKETKRQKTKERNKRSEESQTPMRMYVSWWMVLNHSFFLSSQTANTLQLALTFLAVKCKLKRRFS